MRIDRQVTAVGGKGLDASVSLGCQGVKSTALTFVAGDIGRELVDRVSRYGVHVVPIWVEGETRLAHVIVERHPQQHTHLTSGRMIISAKDEEAFLRQLTLELQKVQWLICGGSLPKGMDTGFLAQVVERANEAGVKSLVDTSAVPIDPVLLARPTLLKFNLEEFKAAFDLQINDFQTLIEDGIRLKTEHRLQNLLITCGQDGLYALIGHAVYHVQAASQAVVNAAGAGDAVSGTLAYRLMIGDSWPEALRQASAVSAATVLTEATAECNPDDIACILPTVKVKQLK